MVGRRWSDTARTTFARLFQRMTSANTTTARTPCRAASRIAGSTSSTARSRTGRTSKPSDRAASRVSSNRKSPFGLPAIHSAPTSATRPSACANSSSRLPLSSGASSVSPVMLFPGLARLVTIPLRTGSLMAAMTTGIVVVACLAACAAAVPSVTMMSTGRAISSRANRGSAGRSPFANRYSI
jgi:hypothetical protein